MKSNLNLVSVIIPCYNDHKYIEEAIKSVNEQTHKDLEIIIIDDGSDVETKEVLKKIKQENLIVLYQENQGPSTARNNGIRHAKGDLILTLDADDYFEKTFVKKAIEVLEKEPKVGLVTCNGYIFDESGIVGEIISKEGSASDFLFVNTAIGNSLFRKKCWSDIGGFDEKMKKGYEDWDFHISVLKYNWEIKVIEEYLFNYRNKYNSRNNSANKVRYELIHYLLTKHKDLSMHNFDKLLENVFSELDLLSSRGNNLKKTVNYRLGKAILMPFRFIKSFF